MMVGMTGLLGYTSGYQKCIEQCDTLVMLGTDLLFYRPIPIQKMRK